MTDPTLPLLSLFTHLRQSGLLLGVEEYLLAQRALQAGFGISADPYALARLCRALWVKSPEDEAIFTYHYAQLLAEETAIQQPSQELEQPLYPRPVPQKEKSVTETVSPKPTSEATSTLPRPTPDLPATPEKGVDKEDPVYTLQKLFELTDEMAVAQAVEQITAVFASEEPSSSYFRFSSNYLPVTRRQLKQNWRYLRQMIREGPPVELDVTTTVNQTASSGILLDAVLRPRRVNRSKLLLLMDQDGSMAPFHTLSQRLVETALRGGRIGHADVYYFHDCPVGYIYHDPYYQSYQPISALFKQACTPLTSLLIFSDGGAARGNLDLERLAQTHHFLKQLKRVVRYMAWLNPVPPERWLGTTAGEIAQLVPMFPMSQVGLHKAIKALRSRHVRKMEGHP